MDDLWIALSLAAVFSILICAIEVKFESKKVTFRNCITSSFALYGLIVFIGNAVTTLLVAATLGELLDVPPGAPAAASQASSGFPVKVGMFKRVPWFWYAFIGVFGFEVLVQKINVSFHDIGLLSINDWMNKARENAVGMAIEAQADANEKRAQTLAGKLRMLPEADLNAQVLNILGPQRLDELNGVAQQAGADSRFVKSLALAQEAPDRAGAIH